MARFASTLRASVDAEELQRADAFLFYRPKMNEELLISLVQKYPELYNHGDPRYHDDQRRINIWEEI